MKILFLLFFLHTVLASDVFGTSFLKDQRLCREWTCINTKLGLTDTLPPRDQFRQVLRGLLPEAWHGVVETTLEGCYGNRSRRYTNVCPGQALLHCTVDNLIENCPESSWRKSDACSPVTSLAGFRYMFSQGLYENLEANLAYEQRPAWFMRHYFNGKCCNLPALFNSTVMAECGFTQLMHYHRHSPPVEVVTQTVPLPVPSVPTTESSNSGDFVHVVELPPVPAVDDSIEDPLDCCDMSGFIDPSWRSECDFKLNWDIQNRLTVEKPSITTTPVPTTTTTVKPRLIVKVLPLSCTQETCVFQKLNIVSASGSVDIDAFSKLLNNLTTDHPSWSKAKARVVTKCFTRSLTDYKEDCEINKILACTFDVLSENCPSGKKNDPCKRSSTVTNDIVCQIRSAKFGPRNRHQYCDVPSLVNDESLLRECGISSINRLEYSTHVVPVVIRRGYTPMCNKLTDSTSCVLSKMGLLNKYKFVDYFKMKASIRNFTSTHSEWLPLNDAYLSALTTTPMYQEYCSSPKKLLNLIDSMLMTCPLSKRKSSPKCNKILTEISHSLMENKNRSRQQLEQVINQFQHIFLPVPAKQVLHSTHKKVSKKLYDFGILDDGNVPPIKIIDVNPTARPIKVLIPVYQQMYGHLGSDMTIHGVHGDGVLRGGIGRGKMSDV